MNMEHVLMNFGDNIRVMQDSAGKPFQVGIGEIVRADIHPVHARMIQNSIADETLIVCSLELAAGVDRREAHRFGQVMECLRDIDGEDYDSLLERFNQINGPNPDEMRPTRDMVRIALREIARQEVKKLMRLQKRVRIHEQGDETTRQDPRDLPPPTKPAEPPPPAPQKAAGAAGDQAPGESPPAKRKIKRERL